MKLIKSILLLLLWVWIEPVFAQLSGNYTINPSGTGNKNYTTIGKAFAALDSHGVSGSTQFTISAGNYNGGLSLTKLTGSSSSKQVRFRKDPKAKKPVVIQSTSADNMELLGVKWLVFEGITFRYSSSSAGYNIEMSQGAEHIRFNKCTVQTTGINTQGVNLYQADNAFFHNCIIDGGKYAMFLYGTSTTNGYYAKIDSCTIKNASSYGIYSMYADDLELDANLFDSCRIAFESYNGHRAVINGNRFFDGQVTISSENASGGNPGDSSLFTNNMVHASGNTGYGLLFTSNENLHVIHNSFKVKGTVNGSRITNPNDCIFLNNNWESEGGIIGAFFSFGSSTAPAVFDYNNLKWSGNNTYAFYGNANVSNFGALQSAYSQFNQNSFDSLPLFVSNRDLRSYSRALNNVAKMSHVKTDFEGNARPHVMDSLPDVGCNEFHFTLPDLDIVDLLKPQTTGLSATVIEARFKNAGATAIRNTRVRFSYSVDSGLTWTHEIDTIAFVKPGETIDYAFTNTWTPSRLGNFGIHIKVNYIGYPAWLAEEDSFYTCSGLQGIFYVGNGQNNFPTLSSTLKQVEECGLTGNLRLILTGGTYNQQIKIGPIKRNGNAQLIIDGQHPDSVMFKYNTKKDEGVFELNNSSYVQVKNLRIDQSDDEGVGIMLWNGSSYCTIDNCVIAVNKPTSYYKNAGIGIFSDQHKYTDARNIVVKNCLISGQYFGVETYGIGGNLEDFSLLQNEIVNCKEYGMYLQGINRIEAIGNYFNISSNSFYMKPYYQVYCRATKVFGNRVGNYELHPFSLFNENWDRVSTSIFANNVVEGDCFSANNVTGALGVDILSSYNLNVFHNSLQLSYKYQTQHPTGLYSAAALRVLRSSNITCVNNVLMVQDTSSLLFPLNIDTSFGQVQFEHNHLIYANGAAAYIDGKRYSAASNLPFISAFSNSTDYLNFKGNSLELSTTKANPRGKPVGIVDDIDGVNRCPYAPSIGAYESAFRDTFSAGFKGPDTLYVGSPSAFFNQHDSFQKAHEWWVDGKLASQQANFIFSPTYKSTYKIVLISNSCDGTDTASKTVYAISAYQKPVAKAKVLMFEVDLGECIEIHDASLNGPSSIRWVIQPQANQPLSQMGFCNNSSLGAKVLQANFDEPGYYRVSLVVANKYGSDSLFNAAMVYVRPSLTMCGTVNQFYGPSGSLFDDGGKSSNYTSNNICGYTISQCADTLTLHLDDLRLATGSYLRIYEGISNKGKPLHLHGSQYTNGLTGNLAISNIASTYTSYTGDFYIEFESGSLTDAGFALRWNSSPANLLFNRGGFQIPDTVCQNALITVESPVNPSYHQGFLAPNFSGWTQTSDGGSIGTIQFKNQGIDSVFDKHFTCSGWDSVFIYVQVLAPTKVQSVFSIDKQRAEVNETVSFTDQSQNTNIPCSQDWEWRITPTNKSFKFVNNTNRFSQHPQIQFLDTGYYSVQQKVANGSLADSSYFKNLIFVYEYCNPVVSYAEQLVIDTFSFQGKAYQSGASKIGYDDFSNALTFNLYEYQPHKIELARTGNYSAEAHYSVWIDFDLDGQFESSELVASLDSSTLSTWSDTFSIRPSMGYLYGSTKMRVGLQDFSKARNACSTVNIGEYEDYEVVIHRTSINLQVHLFGGDTTLNQCDKGWSDPGAYGSSLLSPVIAITTTLNNIDLNKAGLYEIIYIVRDNKGNEAKARRKVRVVPDTQAPELQLVGINPLNWPVNTTYYEPGYSASDNCDGNLSSKVQTLSTVDTTKLGSYSILYWVADANGNADTVIRVVNVVDVDAPVISSLKGDNPTIVPVFGSYVERGFNWTDNYYPFVRDSIVGIVDTSKIGTYTLHYYAIDPDNNVSKPITRTVEVVDTVKPSISLSNKPNATDTLQVYEKYFPEAYTVNDNYSSESYLRSSITYGGNYYHTFGLNQANELGMYQFIYRIEDESGNSDSAIRNIQVVDTVAPTAKVNNSKGYIQVPRWFSGDLRDSISFNLDKTDNFYQSHLVTYKIVDNQVDVQSTGAYFAIIELRDPSNNKRQMSIWVDVIETDQTLNVPEQARSLLVYPNPANQVVFIQFADASAQSSLFNSQGQLVKFNDHVPKAIDVSTLSEGVYHLQLKGESYFISKKIIVQH